MSVVVVGGGLAGTAAAIRLARGGAKVVLVEREARAQHKVCGEFLSVEALGYLVKLGVDVVALGGVEIRSVRLAGGGEVRLPFAAMSLTRCRVDEELLQLAGVAGVTVLRGCGARSLERAGEGWSVLLEDGRRISAEAVFQATGKHDLRGRARPKGKQSDLVAFKMYWQLAEDQAAALDGYVELMLYRGGYAGFQLVEGGAANLCCLVERKELRRLGGWDALLEAMQVDCVSLRERLREARPLLEKPLAISSIPYGYVRQTTDGVWAVGDQAAVIPSFTGDGMSIALHSGCLAAAMYLNGGTAEEFQRRLNHDLSGQVAFATAISRALVWKSLRTSMMTAVKMWPGLLNVVAKRTRIAAEAIR